MKTLPYVFSGIAFFILTTNLFAQSSGPAFYRSAVMNGNQIQTVFGNWGVIGQPVDDRPRGAWLSSTNGYIGDMSLLLAVELPIKDYNGDGLLDTVHSVITCPVSRPALSPDQDPVTWEPWTFMPDSGFFNTSDSQLRVAMSNDPGTWPVSWSDGGVPAWKGLYGMGKTVGSLEAYFRMDDQNDRRFNYAANNRFHISFRPDSLHLNRMGLGIAVGVRYIQVDQPLLRDVLFRIYDIINEGTTNYEKVALGSLTGTLVGVTGKQDFGEYDDDIALLYKPDNLIVFSDFPNDNSRNPFWAGEVGKCGEAFLSAPNANQIASYYNISPAGMVRLGDDEALWKCMTPGCFRSSTLTSNDTIATGGEDGDYIYASAYFALKVGEMKRIASLIAFGYSKNEILQKTLLASALYNLSFDNTALKTSAAFQASGMHSVFSGNQSIKWTSASSGGSMDLYYSPDAGTSWTLIVKGAPNTGTFQWNTSHYPDCSFGLFRIFVKDSSGKYVGFAESPDYFTIHNTSNPTPFVKIQNTEFGSGKILSDAVIPLHVLIGNPQGSTVTLSVYSQERGTDKRLVQQVTMWPADSSQTVAINIAQLPNSDSFRLFLEAAAENFLSADSTPYFIKRTPRLSLPTHSCTFLSGHTDVLPDVRIVDRSKVTDDDYIISFVDTIFSGPKTFTVFNRTKRKVVLKNCLLVPRQESVLFDGLTLYTEDHLSTIDTIQWNKSVSSNYYTSVTIINIPEYPTYCMPGDYKVIFGTKDTSTDFGGAATQNLISYSVYNSTNGKHVAVVDDSGGGRFSAIFVEKVAGEDRLTWRMFISADTHGILPHAGDTLYLTTHKGLSLFDSLEISNAASPVFANAQTLPDAFALLQNYPNPFNGTTQFTLNIRSEEMISVVIFDVLGRKASEILHQRLVPGTYRVPWDASRFASGVYFCRMTAGNFSEMKRAVLVR